MEITTIYDTATTEMLDAIKETIIGIERQKRKEFKELYLKSEFPQQEEVYAIQRKHNELKYPYISLQSKILSCALPKYILKVEKDEEVLLTQLLNNLKKENGIRK